MNFRSKKGRTVMAALAVILLLAALKARAEAQRSGGPFFEPPAFWGVYKL